MGWDKKVEEKRKEKGNEIGRQGEGKKKKKGVQSLPVSKCFC